MSKMYGGRYEIEDRIGAGGMAIVYRAKDTLLNRTVAIKVLREQLASDEGFIRRFRREAQAAASLSHQNIVSIFDVGKDGQEDYIVMEYVLGSTLKDIIRQEAPMSPQKALMIVRQIAEALAHAHANHIIHRDIKPQNILITLDGRVKVTDFGIARAVSSATLTHTGDIVGSVHYLSPEQAKGSQISEQSDIYSLGIILYEMITGKVPYDGDTPITIALKHIQEDVELPSKIGMEVPPEIDTLIMKALAKSVDDRYKSALEFLADLDRIQTGQTIIWEKKLTEDQPDALRTQVHKGLRQQLRSAENQNLEDTWHKRKVWKKRLPKPVVISLAVIVVCSIIALGIGKYFFVPNTTVPDLMGMTITEAEKELEKNNLVLGENPQSDFSEDYEEGLIIDQDYKPYSTVKAGRVISVVVSKGPERLEFPDVTSNNPTEENAISMIKAAGFPEKNITIEYRANTIIEKGHVIGQNPGPKSIWPTSSPIKLYVSSGQELTMGVMPDVSDYSSSQAKETLEAYGLVVAAKPEPSDEYPIDIVITTVPKAGQPVKQGSEVIIVVSQGPGPPP
ncbi:MAG: Stk1 family PASTA domain-containing Ser/Thr kinase [Peptococcaceae bacterium]|nr:Stk1 family PASTA domain-containing Ser/Thr kinase [Peptococcaceae bacterium]